MRQEQITAQALAMAAREQRFARMEAAVEAQRALIGQRQQRYAQIEASVATTAGGTPAASRRGLPLDWHPAASSR